MLKAGIFSSEIEFNVCKIYIFNHTTQHPNIRFNSLSLHISYQIYCKCQVNRI